MNKTNNPQGKPRRRQRREQVLIEHEAQLTSGGPLLSPEEEDFNSFLEGYEPGDELDGDEPP